MRKKIVAGNWKMNTTVNEGISLAEAINSKVKDINLDTETKVIIGPPFIHLSSVNQVINKNLVLLSAQNCAAETSGAYTGEVSATMLKSIGCDAVIIGHSERRAYYGETSEILSKKVKQVLENEMMPIFCCGELLEEREKGNHFKIVEDQIAEALFELSNNEFSKIVIAYEPVWAIGTGVTASKEQAQEMHAFIRKIVKDKFGDKISDDLSILYGGSVKPDNAEELFSQEDVDGGLIGGAALKTDSFIDIIKAI